MFFCSHRFPALKNLIAPLLDNKILLRLFINVIGGGVIALGPILVAPLYINSLDILNYAHIQKFLTSHLFVVVSLGSIFSAYTFRELFDDSKNSHGIDSAKLVSILVLSLIADLVFISFLSIFSIYSVSDIGFIEFKANFSDLIFGFMSGLLAAKLYLISGYYLATENLIMNRASIALPIVLNIILLSYFKGTGSWIFFACLYVLSNIIVLTGVFATVWKYLKKELLFFKCRNIYPFHNIVFFLSISVYVFFGVAGDNYYRFASALILSHQEFASIATTLVLAGILPMIVAVLNLTIAPIFYGNAQKWLKNGVWVNFLIAGLVFTMVANFVLNLSWPYIASFYQTDDLILRTDLFITATTVYAITSVTWAWALNIAFFEKANTTIILAGFSSFIVVVGMTYFFASIGDFGHSITYIFSAAQIVPILILIAFNKSVRNIFPVLKVLSLAALAISLTLFTPSL